MSLKGKNILLGITGSISAYKTPFLIRELIKENAFVKCVITKDAKRFVSKLVLENLSKNAVIDDMFDERFQDSGSWHIQAANECDLFIIAPCSANTAGKIANGICENALTVLTTAVPSDTPRFISPAMDSEMWENAAIQRNIKQLEEDGYNIIEPGFGELASGIVGKGRLPEVEDLINTIKKNIK